MHFKRVKLLIYAIEISHLFIKLILRENMEKAMAAHSSILAWRVPWTEEAGGLRPMGSQRLGHD